MSSSDPVGGLPKKEQASEVEVNSADVVKLVLQFLKENNLHNSLVTLQEESRIKLGTVESRDGFLADINHGRWPKVAKQMATLSMPRDLVCDIYQQMFLEFLEFEQKKTCLNMLKYCEPLAALRKSSDATLQGQYKRLESLINRPYIPNAQDIYENVPRDLRRQKLAQRAVEFAVTAPPGRLMALVDQAIRWQRYSGVLPDSERVDLFRNRALPPWGAAEDAVEDLPPTHPHKELVFSKGAFATVVCFSPDGQYLATGAQDGIIEIWNYSTGKRAKDLKFQQERNFLIMPQGAVTALCFSQSGRSISESLIAAGDSNGHVRVWKLTGELLWDLERAHASAVMTMSFGKGAQHLLTGSLDFTARVHGMKSGKTIREFSGHSSCVNQALFSNDGAKIVTGASDGFVKVFDGKSGSNECLSSFQLPTPPHLNPDIFQPAIRKIEILSPDPEDGGRDAEETLLISTRSNVIYHCNFFGQVLKFYDSGHRDETTTFVSFGLSPRGKLVYALSERGTSLFCFDFKEKKLVQTIEIQEKGEVDEDGKLKAEFEFLDFASHPTKNLVACASQTGKVFLFKA